MELDKADYVIITEASVLSSLSAAMHADSIRCTRMFLYLNLKLFNYANITFVTLKVMELLLILNPQKVNLQFEIRDVLCSIEC
jgi:hypothetical protein